MQIRCENLIKTYNSESPHEVSAIKDVNLAVPSCAFTAITGPSGSGKSTLLGLLGLLIRQTKGRIFYQDEEVSAYSDAWRTRIRKEKVSFIFQQFNLLPQFLAWQNVACHYYVEI